MRIVMATNTYKPITGGLEKSVSVFSEEYRKRGHQVLIVTPEHKDAPEKEKDVFRLAAIQNFNGTDFSVELPVHFNLTKKLDEFRPDIIHAHHPFLVGDTALRIAEKYKIPLVFTHHTLYEEYTHYVPFNAKGLKKFVINLASEYANLSDHVFVPSESIFNLIESRGVRTKKDVIPTGVYIDEFAEGKGSRCRERFEIKKDVFLIGTVGRVAPEKNIEFLTDAVTDFLKKERKAGFLVVGEGDSLELIKERFKQENLSERLYCAGILSGRDLVDAYHALDVFAFASHSETQGLVLIEAMAAGVPVVAVDAPGVREVVEEKMNGRLLEADYQEEFSEALEWVYNLSEEAKKKLKKAAKSKAEEFSVSGSVDRALGIYEELIGKKQDRHCPSKEPWAEILSSIKAEMKLAKGFAEATRKTLQK